MEVLQRLRNVADLSVLGMTARSAEAYRRDDGYDDVAASLESRVATGACDPVAAEAALNDHLAAKPEDFTTTPRGERGAKALERLVSSGILDPIFAENILDRGFSTWAVRDAVEHIQPTDT